MEILLRQVRILDPSSSFHQQQADILIRDGRVTEIAASLSADAKEIRIENAMVSPGWVDPFAHFCDPGFEFRETLDTGAAAAARGGFTDVLVLPNTSPVLHNKAGVEYVVQKSGRLPVSIHPIGAVTRNAEGKELAEMYDMQASGALAFSDGQNPVQSGGVLLKALQYLKATERMLIQLPDDRSIAPGGLMNEGIVSTQLGLPGKPAIAEELMIRRDLELLRYTEGRLHITGISTARGVELIRQAKTEGLHISCSIASYQLCFTDEDLTGYDTNLKLNPPLRTRSDQDALRQGLLDGTIDCIASHHLPHDTDHKDVEFEYAGYGMASLETSFSVLATCFPELDAARLVELLSLRARKIFGLDEARIAPGASASLTLFDPGAEWKVDGLRSRSKNSPFLGKTLRGRVHGIIHRDSLFLNA